MSKVKRQKTALERLALEDVKRRRDYDPEALPTEVSDSDSQSDASDRANDGREHYASVEKSKLRRDHLDPLGPRYRGSKIGRHAADEDEEDDPFARGFDEESSDDCTDDLVGVQNGDLDDDVGLNDQDSEEDDESLSGSAPSDYSMLDGDEGSAGTSQDEEEDREQAEIVRRRFAATKAGVAANVVLVNTAEVERGKAVMAQRKTFDTLLNARIRLQKGLVAANSFPFATSTLADDNDQSNISNALDSAESAALTLLSTLSSLQSSSSPSKKRKFTPTTTTSSFNALLSSAHSTLDTHALPTLSKWANRTMPASSSSSSTTLTNSGALRPRRQLVTNGHRDTSDFAANLKGQLLSTDRLLQRARTPRSCAPLQVTAATATAADSSSSSSRRKQQSHTPQHSTTTQPHPTHLTGPLYDDADFYALLLSDLLSRHSHYSAASSTANINAHATSAAILAAKTANKQHRPNVDVKASKGRAMRYGVHEKLVDFMAAEERGNWEEGRRRAFFGALFGGDGGTNGAGGNGAAVLDEDEGMGEMGDQEEKTLRLF